MRALCLFRPARARLHQRAHLGPDFKPDKRLGWGVPHAAGQWHHQQYKGNAGARMDAGLVTVQALRDAGDTIRAGLRERIKGGMRAPQALDGVYATLYAGRITEVGRLLFRQLCARMARQIAMEYADRAHPYAPWKATGAEVRAWLYWLEKQDRTGAHIMELCYFAGLGVKHAARVVGLDPPTILRVLREHKAHLSYSLPPLPEEKPA